MRKLKSMIYEDPVIAVGLFTDYEIPGEKTFFSIGLRWLPPRQFSNKPGEVMETTNVMGGETDWMLLPTSFGAAVGRRMVEQKNAGLAGFSEPGFSRMVCWLKEIGELCDSMEY